MHEGTAKGCKVPCGDDNKPIGCKLFQYGETEMFCALTSALGPRVMLNELKLEEA